MARSLLLRKRCKKASEMRHLMTGHCRSHHGCGPHRHRSVSTERCRNGKRHTKRHSKSHSKRRSKSHSKRH